MNGGVDWFSTFANQPAIAYAAPNPFFQGLSIDPTDRLHIVASIHDNCAHEFAPICLMETFNGGTTWNAIKGPPQLQGWAERASPIVLDAKELVFRTWLDGMYYTNDGGKNWSSLGIDGYSVPYTAKDGYTYLPGIRGMNRTKNWRDWTPAHGAPSGDVIAGDGVRIFTAWDDNSPKMQVTFENNTSAWTAFPLPTNNPKRIASMTYDAGHSLLLVGATGDGLWRMVTK